MVGVDILDVLVRVEDFLGIKHVFNTLHQANELLVLAVTNVVALGKAKTMLSRDGARNLGNPFVNKGFEQLLDLLVVKANGNVQVQVAITNVAVSSGGNDGVLGSVTDNTGLNKALVDVNNEVIQLRKRDRNVVLVDTATLTEGLGNKFSPLPQVGDFGRVLGNNTIDNDFLSHGVLQKRLKLGIVVLLVGAGGLDQHVEGVLLRERAGQVSVLLNNALRGVVHALKSRKNFTKLLLGLDKSTLDLLKGLKTKESNIDRGGSGRTEDRNTSDNTKGTLRANKQLLQVVTSVVLAEGRKVVDNGTISKNNLETKDSTVQGSIS